MFAGFTPVDIVDEETLAPGRERSDEIEMVNLATPVFEALSRDTGESSHFTCEWAMPWW